MKTMAMPLHYYFSILVILLLLDSALALATGPPGFSSGTASHHHGLFVDPNCPDAAKNGMVAGARQEIFNHGAACGKTFVVACTDSRPNVCKDAKATVAVKIVDSCADEPNSQCTTFVLSEDAFAELVTDAQVGEIEISYQPAQGN